MNTTSGHNYPPDPELDLLLRYVYGELPEDQRKQVVNRIEAEPALATLMEGIERYRVENDFKSIAEHREWIAMQNKTAVLEIDSWVAETAMEPEPHPQLQPGSIRIRPLLRHTAFLAIAAAIAFLIGILFFDNSNSISTEELIAQYSAPPFSANQKGPGASEGDLSEIYERLSTYYEKAESARGLEEIKQLIAEDPKTYKSLRFHAGFFHLQQGETDKAIEAFKAVSEDSSIIYHQQARTELGLAFLRANQVDRAIGIFQQIIQDPDASNYRKKQAKGIWDALDQ